MKPLYISGLLLLGGCITSYTAPEDRLFPAGSYPYEARLLLPGDRDSTDYSGRLELTAVTPDSLVGHWAVPGYEPELRENHFNVVSFNVHAKVGAGADSLTVIHSIQRNSATGLPSCAVRITRPGYLAEGRCELGPAR